MWKRTLGIVLLLLTLAGPVASAPTLASLQSDFASVDISPTYQELGPGGMTTLTIVGQSTIGGSVFLNLPASLELVGDPICTNGCRTPFVTNQGGGSTIEFNIDGQMAIVSLTVVVATFAPVGSVINVSARLVGGPDAVEMASATIVVVEGVPTPMPASREQPPSGGVGDNRMVYLDVSPPSLRIAPGGQTLYHVQPVRWGMWGEQGPQIDVMISVPDELVVAAGPSCGRGDITPEEQRCSSVTGPTEGPGGSQWTITPGYDTFDGTANGIYMTLSAADDVAPDVSLQVTVSATVHDASVAEQPAEVVSSVMIVSSDSLLTPHSDANSVGAVLELSQGFTVSGSSCVADDRSSQVGLWEAGLGMMFGFANLRAGVLGVATDGTGSEVCHVPVVFANVPPRDLYVLARYDGTDFPCRACVYGTVTTTRAAEVVFSDRW